MRALLPVCISSLIAVFISVSAQAGYYGSKLCKTDGYVCYKTHSRDSWNSLFPDPHIRDLVRRVNRINVSLPHGVNIAIPKDLDADFMEYSPFPNHGEVIGNKYIVVSLSKLAFGAYDENGDLQYWGPVSSARGYCSDIGHGCHTPTGTFAIYSKGGSDCVSTKFPVGRGGAPMPYCMFFHGGFALHGSYDVMGYNASHGCVRLFIEDAKWLNHQFTAGVSHVPVIINP